MYARTARPKNPGSVSKSIGAKHVEKPAYQAPTIAEYLSLLTAFAFAASVARAFGAQVALGPEILRYFSISDYLNHAVPLMVYILAGVSVVALAQMFSTRGSKTSKELKRWQKEKEKSRDALWSRISSFGTFALFTAVGIVYGMRSSDFLLGLLLCLQVSIPMGWALLAVWYLKDPTRPHRYTRVNFVLIVAIPAVVLSMFLAGAWEARLALYSLSQVHNVHTTNGDISARYVLPLDRYWIIKKVDGTVIVISASEVKMVENP